MAECPHNFCFIWKDQVAGSAHPGVGAELAESLAGLRENGIVAILSLTEQPLDASLLREFDMDYLHLPIDDFTAPSQQQIQEAVRFVSRHSDQDEGTLVHCRAGLGRTGTILACFLVAQGYEPDKAIREIRRRRPGSLEVYQQEYCVYEFARQLKQNESSH